MGGVERVFGGIIFAISTIEGAIESADFEAI